MNVTERFPDDSPLAEDALQLAPATLISLILHLVLLIILALFTRKSANQEPLLISVSQLSSEPSPMLQSIAIEQSEPELPDAIDEVSPVTVPFDLVGVNIQPVAHHDHLISVLPSDGHVAELEGISDDFAKIVFDARKNGIEIVIVFDSTSSMMGEIETVKQRIGIICNAVLRKIPEARFSLVTYRDKGDNYLVRGIGLDNDIARITEFINSVQANGGGDTPEAVEVGMFWAVSRNEYRPYSRKAMLIFGDAPPHQDDMRTCLDIAAEFRDRENASVHTISCRKTLPMNEFYLIANAGGGRAFVLNDVRGLMEELLVLAFGPEHRKEVLKFFELEGPAGATSARRRRR